jgi:hypothetical protein
VLVLAMISGQSGVVDGRSEVMALRSGCRPPVRHLAGLLRRRQEPSAAAQCGLPSARGNSGDPANWCHLQQKPPAHLLQQTQQSVEISMVKVLKRSTHRLATSRATFGWQYSHQTTRVFHQHDAQSDRKPTFLSGRGRTSS